MNKHKKWRENNLELARQRVRDAVAKHHKNHCDGMTRVYELKCGYIGITKNLMSRMKNHKYIYKRDVTDYVILATCPTRDEARDLEALYQSINNLTVDDNTRLRPIL